MYKSICLFAIATVLYSCQETTSTPAVSADKSQHAGNTAADIDSIKAVFQNILNAAIIVDPDTMAPYFSRSNQTVFVDGDAVVHTGYDEFYKTLKQIFSGFKSQTVNAKKLEIQFLSENAAVGITNGDFAAVTKDGKTFKGDVAWTFIFTRETTGWKVLKLHESVKMH